MANKEKILNALAQLDPLDDDQWTTDGSVKVEIVSALVGEVVKRQDIVNAAPDFNREKASIADDKFEEEEEVISQTEIDDEVQLSSDSSDLDFSLQTMSLAQFQAWLHTTPKEQLEEIKTALGRENDRAGAEIKNLEDLQKRIASATSMTRARIKEVFPNSADAYAIRAFIDSQTAARATRAERRQEILKVIRPEELDYRSPIDVAMGRRNKREAQRPIRPLANN